MNVPAGARAIRLTKGLVTIVDEADFAWLSQWKWLANAAGHGSGRIDHRAGRRVADGTGRRPLVMMHNLILPPPPGLEVDHINRQGLDNRRSNLRHATRRENSMNRAPWGGASPFKGVTPHKGRWAAYLRIDGRNTRLGTFDTQDAAARAYDRAAFIHYGEFAYLNFGRAA